MVTLCEAIDAYEHHCGGLATRTQVIYQAHLDRVAAEIGDPALDQIDRHCLADFMVSLRGKNGRPYSPGYLRQIWRTLHTFFAYCVEAGWIEANPMRRVRKPPPQSGVRERLSLGQIARLIEATRTTRLSDRNRAIILLMVDSGLRLGEVTGLRMADIDLADETVHIHSTRSGRSRTAPLHLQTMEALELYWHRYRFAAEADDPFFLNRDGSPITVAAIHQFIKRLGHRLAISLHAYLLRHSFAAAYIRCGRRERLRQIMGHSPAETAELTAIKAEHRLASPLAQLARQPAEAKAPVQR